MPKKTQFIIRLVLLMSLFFFVISVYVYWSPTLAGENELSDPPGITYHEYDPYRFGDVNNDGWCNFADAIPIWFKLTTGQWPENSCEEAADFNGNGIVNIADCIALYAWACSEGDPPAYECPDRPGSTPSGGIIRMARCCWGNPGDTVFTNFYLEGSDISAFHFSLAYDNQDIESIYIHSFNEMFDPWNLCSVIRENLPPDNNDSLNTISITFRSSGYIYDNGLNFSLSTIAFTLGVIISPDAEGCRFPLVPEADPYFGPQRFYSGESGGFQRYEPDFDSVETTVIGIDITKSANDWIPKYDSSAKFTARIYEIDVEAQECTYPGPSGFIYFVLDSTSNELGYCLNKGTRDAMDLHFNTSENEADFEMVEQQNEECDLENGPHDHWIEVKTSECVTEATIHVKSEDYGSFGEIRAYAKFPEDCNPPENLQIITLLPREPGQETDCECGKAKTKIPRDENGNDIADNWYGDDIYGNSDPAWDGDDLPHADIDVGDGITRYEEYRGFTIQDTLRRMSTTIKELYIYRENDAWGAADPDWAADVRFIKSDEMNGAYHDNEHGGQGTINTAVGPRIVNFNAGAHTKRRPDDSIIYQHGLWRAVGGQATIRKGNWGLARDSLGGMNVGPGSPRTGGRIEIYSENITAACASQVGILFQWGIKKPYRDDAKFFYNASTRANELIGDLIGHEVGHRINLWHHLTRKREIENTAPDIADPAPEPGESQSYWLDVNGTPVSYVDDWPSDANSRECVMRYPYFEIYRSVSLKYKKHRGKWHPIDYDWTPTVHTCDDGYGTTCSTDPRGSGLTCKDAVKIDDAN